MVKICREHSGNDRRMRAPRHIIDPFDEACSVRAHRSRARSLRVFSSSPHMHTSDERSNQRKSRGLWVGKHRALRRAGLAVDRAQFITHGAAVASCQTTRSAQSLLCPAPTCQIMVRVSRDPTMVHRRNSQDTRGSSSPARPRSFVKRTFLNFEIRCLALIAEMTVG